MDRTKLQEMFKATAAIDTPEGVEAYKAFAQALTVPILQEIRDASIMRQLFAVERLAPGAQAVYPVAHDVAVPVFVLTGLGYIVQRFIEAVGEVTGQNFIIDPRVNGNVTMLSSTPMSPDAFYEAFLSILEVYGFIAMKSGDITKILPNASARQYPGFMSTDGAAADDMVTQVVQVQNVGAAQLVPILRPLIPQYGHLAAHPGSNMLIISDRSMNVDRMMRIIRRIDQSNDEDIEVVPLLNASASEVVRVLTALTQAPRSDGVPVTTSLVADARTNSILIGGDRSERLRLRALIAHLDTPLEDG